MDDKDNADNKNNAYRSKKSPKAGAQVGTWVVPMSTCEGSAHQPAPAVGRPAAKKKRQRLPPLSVRTSAEQRAAIKEKAKATGLSVNRYLLLLACGSALVSIRPSTEDRIERAGALRAFRGTGTLLNQIARHLNSGRIIGSFDIAALLKRHEHNAAAALAAFIKNMPDEKR